MKWFAKGFHQPKTRCEISSATIDAFQAMIWDKPFDDLLPTYGCQSHVFSIPQLFQKSPFSSSQLTSFACVKHLKVQRNYKTNTPALLSQSYCTYPEVKFDDILLLKCSEEELIRIFLFYICIKEKHADLIKELKIFCHMKSWHLPQATHKTIKTIKNCKKSIIYY